MGGAGGGKVLMALGVALALIGGIIVFVIAQTSTSDVPVIPVKAIVVASIDIPERTKIAADQVRLIETPEAIVAQIPGAVLRVEDVADKWAKETIYAGTPVLGVQLAIIGDPDERLPEIQPGQAPVPKVAPELIDAAFTLKKEETVVAVDYPEAVKLITAGILQPGDRVDIYVRAPWQEGEQIALIYPNMEIKAIGKLTQTAQAAPSATLVFVVEPQVALYLKFIENMNPFLLLRAASSDPEDTEINTDIATIDQIYKEFQLQRAPGAP